MAQSLPRWSNERIFYASLTLALLASLVLGFTRTLFLRPLFPEAVAAAPRESFFYLHGVFFVAWFVLLGIQEWLVVVRRVATHRTLGWVGTGLAVAMIGLGFEGALIAARRPTGFFGITMPPLQFLVVPLADLTCFALFVALAVVKRRDAQSHKRYMLLATLAMMDAVVVRWPFAFMSIQPPVPFFMSDLVADLFLIPLVAWDLASRGRPHPVTVWGSIALVASQPLRLMLAGTGAWMTLAEWLVR